ncbi:NAD(P)/FAD-dependent oxidoreductase [Mariniflexile ostreae]|uniref:NAD(P)/FAD-dependent oxidoreductase n=1 Tax=Mariniflexile ostreae TaxID=1520892 RepID=A0ABV5F8V1_9FLAO
MEVDYIIIGNGLAGISFCEQLKAQKKTFVVFDNNSQQSSVVAGGLYNPVVLKRFTPVWKSDEQLQMALTMYQSLEQELGVQLDYKVPVRRKFTSVEEQNDWFTASDKPILHKYLRPKIIKNVNNAINAPFGLGEVLQTGRLDVKTLIDHYRAALLLKNICIEEAFQYELLQIHHNKVQYQNIIATYIVFAEGFGITQNPFFNDLPLVPTKGELLTIYAPDLKIDYVLKGPVFLIPLGNDLYSVGATYEWEDTTHNITEKGKIELLEKLKTLITCSFKIIGQVAGIRPTVKDRRPLVGQHEIHKNMFVLNGLGTRGVMIGPYVATQLFNLIENKEPLDKEIDSSRFSKA